jgi:hypothetical protein
MELKGHKLQVTGPKSPQTTEKAHSNLAHGSWLIAIKDRHKVQGSKCKVQGEKALGNLAHQEFGGNNT